ncbi:MAG TPA: hypothetical protein VMJ31_04910 [Methylocystis sp.]|nr:hypothetical protein [Methylocystis sp.]
MRTRLVFALLVIALIAAVAAWGGRTMLRALTRQARARLRLRHAPQHPTIVRTRNARPDDREPHAMDAPSD